MREREQCGAQLGQTPLRDCTLAVYGRRNDLGIGIVLAQEGVALFIHSRDPSCLDIAQSVGCVVALRVENGDPDGLNQGGVLGGLNIDDFVAKFGVYSPDNLIL